MALRHVQKSVPLLSVATGWYKIMDKNPGRISAYIQNNCSATGMAGNYRMKVGKPGDAIGSGSATDIVTGVILFPGDVFEVNQLDPWTDELWVVALDGTVFPSAGEVTNA